MAHGTTRNFKDISNHPIAIMDILVINDTEKEQRYNVTVIEVLEDTDMFRRFTVKNINSTDPDLKVNQSFEIKIPRGRPTSGLVITPEDMLKVKEAGESMVGNIQEHAVDALKEFLDSKPEFNYRYGYKNCLMYLQKLGYLPSDDKKARQSLSYLIRKNKHMFHSTGGSVSSLTPSRVAGQEMPHLQNSLIKTVDFDKLMTGIRMVLDSGIFGEIEYRK